MKKFILILAALLCVSLAVVTCVRSDIDDLWDQIDELTDSQVATISEQLASIESSISSLETLSSNLSSYISDLQTQAASLQTALSETEDKVEDLEDELAEIENYLASAGSDTTSALLYQLSLDKAELLAELTALSTSLYTELSAVYSSIISLQTQNESIEVRIAALETLAATLYDYIAESIEDVTSEVENWASATFLTLEQYYDLSDSVATLTAQVESINSTLQDFADSVATQLRTQINSTITELVTAYLDAEVPQVLAEKIQTTVDSITEEYTSAISTAKEEITTAYTTLLSTSLSDLETSLKSWVSDQLAGYYTIAETDAALSTLKEDLENQLSVQKAYLESLIGGIDGSLLEELQSRLDSLISLINANNSEVDDLQEAIDSLKNQAATDYSASVEEALTEYDGKFTTTINEINANITAQIATVNESISALQTRVDTLSLRLDAVDAALDSLQSTIEKLLSRIQSISNIPEYSDGSTGADYTVEEDGTITPEGCTLVFMVRPSDAAEALAEVWESAVTAKVVTTTTRSTLTRTTVKIDTVTADDTGILSVVLSGTDMPEGFYEEEVSVSACIEISDGNNVLSSSYVSLVPNYTDEVQYEYVDLGLSVKWAVHNIGAENPEDYGYYFSYADLNYDKDSYSSTYYDLNGRSFDNISGNSLYDAATYYWGSKWRMPTKDEAEELYSAATSVEYTTVNDVSGFKYTFSNGNSIFFPGAGQYEGSTLINSGTTSTSSIRAQVWTSTGYSVLSGMTYAYFFRTMYTASSKKTAYTVTTNSGYTGMSVRPVYAGDDE